MITHEEARLNVQQGVKEHHVRRFLVEYISQQEKLQAEHEALKRDVAICKETLNSIKIICNEPSPSMILSLAEISKRYIEIDNLINTYEEKLSKVGKDE